MPPRKSITAIPGLENLNIRDSNPGSSATGRSFKNTISGSFSKDWPPWKSIRNNSQPVSFTVRLSELLRAQAGPENSNAIEQKMVQIRNLSKGPFSHARNSAFYENLLDEMIGVIFGSNYIEHVGTNNGITIKLCRAVLEGQIVNAHIDERDPDYAAGIQYLREHLNITNPSAGILIRSRREVVQHARALDYLVEAYCFGTEPFSVALIKNAHTILLKDQPIEGIPGQYRTEKIAAKYGNNRATIFLDPRAVGRYMNELVADFNTDITEAERTQTLDPYTLAARYCHRMINIHPFVDGNGRLSRMILNAILLKYAGHMVAFGENGGADRDEYLALATRASRKFREEDAENVVQVGHLELGKHIVGRSVRGLNKLLGKLRSVN